MFDERVKASTFVSAARQIDYHLIMHRTWKLLPQRSQLNGLNPVCFLEWVMRLEDWLNALPHTTHLWGFSPFSERKK